MPIEANVSRRLFLGVLAGSEMNWRALVSGTDEKEKLPVIPKRLERAFRAPGEMPNGLQAVSDGLWILDQVDPNKAYKVRTVQGWLNTEGNSDRVNSRQRHHLWRRSPLGRFDFWSQDIEGAPRNRENGCFV